MSCSSPGSTWPEWAPCSACLSTAALRAGGAENVLATTLGRGWWAMPDDNGQAAALGYATIGARSLRVLVTAQLGVPGGGAAATPWRLEGDGVGWKHARGPVVHDNLFLGTVLDGRRETPGWTLPGFDDAAWEDADILHGPRGTAPRRAREPTNAA